MKTIFTLFFLLLTLTSSAQIAQWTFEGNVISASTANNVTASNVSLVGTPSPGFSTGNTIVGGTSGSSYTDSGWPTTATINTGVYFEFTITPNAAPAPGRTLTLSDLTFAERRSATGIRNYSVRTSRDNFAADVASGTVPDDINFRSQSVNLSGPTFQGVDFAITFRIYGYNAEGSAGTWRIDDITINGNTPLPITLTSFKASTLGQEVILDWETTDESNFSHFSVERSLDPRNGFEAIGRVDAKAKLTTDETAYQFVDQTPNFGLNYYRLKKVDIDGSSDYSRIITANMTETSPIVIYPNPSADFIRIKNGEKEAIKSYEIYNISGRLIRQNESPATEIKIQDLPSGMYFLQLKNERNALINRRFIKI